MEGIKTLAHTAGIKTLIYTDTITEGTNTHKYGKSNNNAHKYGRYENAGKFDQNMADSYTASKHESNTHLFLFLQRISSICRSGDGDGCARCESPMLLGVRGRNISVASSHYHFSKISGIIVVSSHYHFRKISGIIIASSHK